MNRFKRLLSTELQEANEILEEQVFKTSIVIPVEKYMDVAQGDKELAQIYAKKDKKYAISIVKDTLSQRMGIDDLPSDLKIDIKFKKIDKKGENAIFDVTVQGKNRQTQELIREII